jgi:Asp-tRNA(Asn)/Glu-tRNA(Gln) amidotransferase B subunit
VARQTKILREGGHVVSETRGWRDEIQETASQRSKEQAHDYRYFPEPDLPYIAFPRERSRRCGLHCLSCRTPSGHGSSRNTA